MSNIFTDFEIEKRFWEKNIEKEKREKEINATKNRKKFCWIRNPKYCQKIRKIPKKPFHDPYINLVDVLSTAWIDEGLRALKTLKDDEKL